MQVGRDSGIWASLPRCIWRVVSGEALAETSLRRGFIRYAEPGEFTRRAFMNDRLDLAQVESLSDILGAETEQQRRAAVRGNSGSLGRTYEGWRQQLLLARGEMEALIDFSEDQHFEAAPAELLSNITWLVREMLGSISLYEVASQRSELLRNGIRIALLGPPNAGKSSLMNQIVGREASIVSDEAGTTRDIVETSLDIRGYLCSFADTAGLRAKTPTVGAVEEEGIRRAKQRAAESDLVIALSSIEPSQAGGHRVHFDMDTLNLAARAPHRIVVINKCDTVDTQDLKLLTQNFKTSILGGIRGLELADPLTISCKDGRSASAARLKGPGLIQAVIDELVQSFSKMTSLPNEMQELLGVTERQRQLLMQCRQHLDAFMVEAEANRDGNEPDIVLAAEHLRFAAASLAQITGRGDSGDVEEVLGVIFERFCVGK
ncbi:hypothetical protein P8C59_007243 [Phyllachora maydis]|uniref:tRNA modification GTPase MnmE n=1 Tax=Phyllachora maydis TaxID=1825666 RepID=A0AAD9I7Z0_9PEZI|nr:hypothetical protein P8C59_007243 [Phyllachora maydis]